MPPGKYLLWAEHAGGSCDSEERLLTTQQLSHQENRVSREKKAPLFLGLLPMQSVRKNCASKMHGCSHKDEVLNQLITYLSTHIQQQLKNTDHDKSSVYLDVKFKHFPILII